MSRCRPIAGDACVRSRSPSPSPRAAAPLGAAPHLRRWLSWPSPRSSARRPSPFRASFSQELSLPACPATGSLQPAGLLRQGMSTSLVFQLSLAASPSLRVGQPRHRPLPPDLLATSRCPVDLLASYADAPHAMHRSDPLRRTGVTRFPTPAPLLSFVLPGVCPRVSSATPPPLSPRRRRLLSWASVPPHSFQPHTGTRPAVAVGAVRSLLCRVSKNTG